MLFSLLQARSIEKPKIMEQLADAVIMIGDPQADISYAQITLWVDEPILSVFCKHDPAAFFITCNPIF